MKGLDLKDKAQAPGSKAVPIADKQASSEQLHPKPLPMPTLKPTSTDGPKAVDPVRAGASQEAKSAIDLGSSPLPVQPLAQDNQAITALDSVVLPAIEAALHRRSYQLDRKSVV